METYATGSDLTKEAVTQREKSVNTELARISLIRNSKQNGNPSAPVFAATSFQERPSGTQHTIAELWLVRAERLTCSPPVFERRRSVAIVHAASESRRTMRRKRSKRKQRIARRMRLQQTLQDNAGRRKSTLSDEARRQNEGRRKEQTTTPPPTGFARERLRQFN